MVAKLAIVGILVMLTLGVISTPLAEEHAAKREAVPPPPNPPQAFTQHQPPPGLAPPPQQQRPPREIYGPPSYTYGPERGYYGGGEYVDEYYPVRDDYGGRVVEEIYRPEVVEKVERYERPYGRRDYYAPREDYGRVVEEIVRPAEVVEKVERHHERPGYHGRYGYGSGRDDYGRVVEEIVRPAEVVEKVERYDRPYGPRCNCYPPHQQYTPSYERYELPKPESYRQHLEGGFPGYCYPLPYEGYKNYDSYKVNY